MTILIVFFGLFQADAAIGECGSKSGDWAQQRLVGTAVDGTTFASFGVDVCFTVAATSTQAMGQNGISRNQMLLVFICRETKKTMMH